jgi:hypothetical protein
MGLRPTKGDEDAQWFNSWQAETPAPPCATNVGQALSPANSEGKGLASSTERYHELTVFVVALPCGRGSVSGSLVTEGHHGIHFRRAARGNVTGRERH